jgi:YNFM family putative membrane transporter
MAGVLLTWPAQLAAVIAGIAVFTVGFFGAHTLASSWVGAFAAGSRAQASSLYLFAYYMGSSLSGTGGGFVFARWGWSGVVALVLVLNVLALVIVGRLRIRNRA